MVRHSLRGPDGNRFGLPFRHDSEVCIFFLDIVIVVGMQIFLESIGRKRTGREIMSQKAMANALAKAATGGPTGAPIPERAGRLSLAP